MLRSFRVANHKSFRDEAELLLMPAYDKSRPVVPVAGVFGANASGKSNLLDAVRWMQIAVRESYARWEPGSGVPRTPFRLDPEAAAQPSLYCVEIIIDGSRYTYGLEVDDERVREEWLYSYPHNRRRVIFQREGDTIRLGSTVPDHRARSDQLSRLTRDNALFLSVSAHNELADSQPIYDWFREGLRFANAGAILENDLLRRLSDEDRRRSLVALIAAADLGISDVSSINGSEIEELMAYIDMVQPEIDVARQESEAHESELKTIQQSVTDPAVRASRVTDLLNRARESFEGDNRRQLRLLELYERVNQLRGDSGLRFHHGKSPALLTFDEQSAGTRSWIGLVSAALSVLDRGSLMVVDEVDASLHPHLTSRLINLFRDAETNPNGAQLLLTTHDATLLDEDTLSRDEIWFVEKEPDSGATSLYPLTDFHPRKNENTEGRYLAGGYGAVPILAGYRFRKALRAGRSNDAAA